MKPGRLLVTLAATVTLSISTAGAAVASPPDSPPSSSQARSSTVTTGCAAEQQGKKTATVRNETDPTVASRAKLQAEQALDSGTANIHTSREAVDTDNATVLRVTTEDKTYSAVTFPLKGNGLSLTSNTTIVLSPDGAPATYSETHLTHNAANHFQMTSYTDGELVKDSDTGHEFVGDDVLQQQLDETRAAIAKQKSAGGIAVPVGA